MESCQSQPGRIVSAKSLQEKVQDLPLLCVESICKFTPTRRLFRLYSKDVPLPGAFWNYGLHAVIKKRLPFSLDKDCERGFDVAVFDAAGAKVAAVKHPEAFRFSPLLDFIERASLDGFITYPYYTSSRHLFVYHGSTVLSHLPMITALSLRVYLTYVPHDPRDLLAPNMKHLLPQLESFVIKRAQYRHRHVWRMDPVLGNFLRALPTDEMSRLKRLHFPSEAFRYALEQTSNSGDSSARPIFSGLTSLGIWQFNIWNDAAGRLNVLRCVSTCYSQVTALSIFVTGEFKPYLDAFRTLPNLNTLGMMLNMPRLQMNGLTFDGSKLVASVTDLRIISGIPSYEQGIFKIATFFPNVSAVALRAINIAPDLLQLATTLFDARHVFPAVTKLGCFAFPYGLHDIPRQPFFWALPSHARECQLLTQFIASPHLPEAVEISQILHALLADDAGLLTAIFCSMQSSSIKSLLLRGPLHREALACLRSHADLNGEDVEVTAWKDRDLGPQPGILYLDDISGRTDVKIIGTKTSGSLKGEQFTIRVLHQSAKRIHIFD